MLRQKGYLFDAEGCDAKHGYLSQMIKEDGIVSQRGNIVIKIEFTKNVICRPHDLDFSFERIQ